MKRTITGAVGSWRTACGNRVAREPTRPWPAAGQRTRRRHSSTVDSKREIIVVRHGETDWNKQLRVQGVTDIPLNDKGVAQAQASAKALLSYLQNSKISIQIYSSPLKRAMDTAQAIADELAAAHHQPTSSTIGLLPRSGLEEWNLGDLEGLRKEEAVHEYPEDWRIFSQWADPMVSWKDARQTLSGDGESMEQLRRRAVDCIHQAMDQTTTANIETGPSPLLIFVTHGGVLGQLLRHVVGGPSTLESEVLAANAQTSGTTTATKYARPVNACISRFEIVASSSIDRSWRISSWADTSHLQGDLAPIGANYDKRQ